MSKLKTLYAGAIAISFATITFANSFDWQFLYKPASVNYAMYSGTLSEPTMPKGKQKSISFEVNGEAAKEIFESIGPDIEPSCPASEGERTRERSGGSMRCYLQGKSKYQCYFGINLKIGKIIPGDIC